MQAVLENLNRRKKPSVRLSLPCVPSTGWENQAVIHGRAAITGTLLAARFIIGCSGLHIVTVHVRLMRHNVRGLGVDYAAARFLLDELAQLRLRLLCATDLFVQFGA